MKTTIEVNDELLRRAKLRAAADGTTLRSLLEEALHRLLDERERRGAGSRLRDARFHGGSGGTRPGVALDDWASVRELADDGRWDHLRGQESNAS